MSVVPNGVDQRESAVRSLEQAQEAISVANSFLASKDIHDYLPYTVYMELVRSVGNSEQGIKVCLDAIASGIDKQVTGEDLTPA